MCALDVSSTTTRAMMMMMVVLAAMMTTASVTAMTPMNKIENNIYITKKAWLTLSERDGEYKVIILMGFSLIIQIFLFIIFRHSSFLYILFNLSFKLKMK